MRPMLVLGCAAALIAIAATGCGGGGSDSPSAPTPPTGQPAPSPQPTGTTIAIVGDRGAQSFTPNPGTIDASRMIAWRNNDSVVHRIVLNDGSMDTGNIAPGGTSAATALPSDGANYHCVLHPGMIGAIAATGGTPPPCTGQYC